MAELLTGNSRVGGGNAILAAYELVLPLLWAAASEGKV